MSSKSNLEAYLAYLRGVPTNYRYFMPTPQSASALDEQPALAQPLPREDDSGAFLIFPDAMWTPWAKAWERIAEHSTVLAQARAANLFASYSIYEGTVEEQVAMLDWLLPQLKPTSSWLYVIGAAAGVAAIAGIFYSVNNRNL